MTYSVKEIFKTLQGEGAQAGRPSVFCRFAGCNLWTGREEDRASAICQFCDTQFVGTDGQNGGKFTSAQALAARIAQFWQSDLASEAGLEAGKPYVVFTGGEPLLQLDAALIAAMKAQGFEIAVETNGTLPAPEGIDWICVSPKAGAPLVQTKGRELKLVFPQPQLQPAACLSLEFDHFWLQPMDGPMQRENTALAVAYCLSHPKWRLSVQTHKFIGID
ncbi:MAG: 7-carboxy-7-deazaguanine synthase [Hyphomicrobiales bacterium]|nr:7-carboxy-7-deazaguanine synthase [Hyphomicrobiales bacterium]MDE2113882.1 7-carboxy-7-deazaguanine synthase [Hyphomicrobiales bacterium]